MWDLKAEHCRAARHLLGWSVTDLSNASGVSKQAIGRFETDSSDARLATMRKLVKAFDEAGIRFQAGNPQDPHAVCSDGTLVTKLRE